MTKKATSETTSRGRGKVASKTKAEGSNGGSRSAKGSDGARAAGASRKVGNAEVQAFLDEVENATRRSDSFVLDEMFQRISGERPRLWGSIVGYGSYTYELASGEKSQAMRLGFSPRKQSLVVYIMPGLSDPAMLERLGKHKAGRACLYIARLANVDLDVLEELAQAAWDLMAERYPG